MLVLEVRFLTGRFHANPWGRHVNEGAVEWPLSPWRLLRALVSAWKRTAPSLSAEVVGRIITALSGAPEYSLPPSSSGHLRHYVPTEKGQRLLLDAFTLVEGPLQMQWPEVELERELCEALDLLLVGLGYLGRADSWTEVVRLEGGLEPNLVPGAGAVELLGAEGSVTLEQLMVETAELRRRGFSRPPGSRWVNYGGVALSGAGGAVPSRSVCLGLYLVGGEVPRAEILALSDRVRHALLSAGGATATLSGKVEGRVREDGHRHLHVLPEGPVEGEVLTRVWLWAGEGFGAEELARLSGLCRLPSHGRYPAMDLVLYELYYDASVLGRGRVWLSYTPFCGSRHGEGLEEQLRRECGLRGLPEVRVEALEGDGRSYQMARQGRKGPGEWGLFRLEFAGEVEGPLCLGGNSHFGMGRFLAEG